MPVRESFQSTSARGLKLSSLPKRLWQKAKNPGVRDPCDIDLTQDRRDRERLDPPEQGLLLRLTSRVARVEKARRQTIDEVMRGEGFEVAIG